MSHTGNGARRASLAERTVAHQVASSNLTTNHFLGTNQRPWMRADSIDASCYTPAGGQRSSSNGTTRPEAMLHHSPVSNLPPPPSTATCTQSPLPAPTPAQNHPERTSSLNQTLYSTPAGVVIPLSTPLHLHTASTSHHRVGEPAQEPEERQADILVAETTPTQNEAPNPQAVRELDISTCQLPTPTASPNFNLFAQHLPQKRPLNHIAAEQPPTRPRPGPYATPDLANHVQSPTLPSMPNDQHHAMSLQGPTRSLQEKPYPVQLQLFSHAVSHPGIVPSQHHSPVHQQERGHSPYHRAETHSRTPSVSHNPRPTMGSSFLAHFDSTVEDMRQRLNLSGQAESLRIPWIRDACRQNDLFFLLLNQLFSLWSVDRQRAEQLGLGPSCYTGFAVLELLFGPENRMPTEFVAFLAGWPNSPYSLGASAELSQWTTSISRFLPQLGYEWNDFRVKFLTRGLPPCAREIEVYLNCPTSVILPRAIFSSIERQLHWTDSIAVEIESFHSAAFELFIRDQKAHFMKMAAFRESGGASQLPPLNDTVRAFAHQYQSLCAQYVRRRSFIQSSPHAVASPPTATTPTFTRHDNEQSMQRHLTLPSLANDSHSTSVTTIPTSAQAPGVHPVQSTNANLAGSRAQAPTRRRNTNTEHTPMISGQTTMIGPIQSDFMQAQQRQATLVVSAMNRANNASSSTSTGAQQSLIPAETPPILNGPLIPPLASLPPFLTNPISEVEALHQVHLQHPVTILAYSTSDAKPQLFQFIDFWGVPPRTFDTTAPLMILDFELSPDVVSLIPKVSESSADSFALPTRLLSTNSVLLNLRCTLLESNVAPDEATWAALQTHWPQHIFISINDKFLEIRRKRHYRRDLPVDVTPFVQVGKNTVKISILGEANEKDQTFAIAVDQLCVRKPEQINDMLTKISFEDSLRTITDSMHPVTDDAEDNDMQIVTNSMTISITDPFSSGMLNIPVRGRSCRHRECFDLINFLASRPKERDGKDILTTAYSWLCPICKKDARPTSLVLDGFLKGVRDQLVANGEDEVRAIIVNTDGTWVAKPEVDNETDRAKSVGRKHKAESSTPINEDPSMDEAVNSAARIVEIIEIDDD